MPTIILEASKMSQEQKETLIAGFTKLASETLDIPAQAFHVFLRENDPDNIGTGGKTLSKILAERNSK